MPLKRELIVFAGIIVLWGLRPVISTYLYMPTLILVATVLLWFVYKSLSTAVVFTIYSTALLLGSNSASVLLSRLLQFSDDDWSIHLLNRDFGLQQIVTLSIFVGLVALFMLLQRFLKRRIDMNIFNGRVIHFTLVSASAVLVFIYVSYVAPDTYINFGQWTIRFEQITYMLFFLSSAIMFVVILRYMSTETAIKAERLLVESSNKYIHDLEESYKALRTIKHDYVNILSTFKLYIDSEDMAGLAKYYYDEFSEINKDLLHQDKLIGSLQNVQINEVKSVLIYKGSVASQNEVDVNIEVREPIEHLGVSTAIVCQIIAILLDNAIEAATEADERKLNIAIVNNPNSKAFIIKNTWREQDIPINRLFELGFSTKGKNRGTGLHTVRNYTEKIKGLHLETEVTDEYFCQILTVKDI
jgi:two-component system sensor histidine kinase AgrC